MAVEKPLRILRVRLAQGCRYVPRQSHCRVLAACEPFPRAAKDEAALAAEEDASCSADGRSPCKAVPQRIRYISETNANA